MEIFGMIRRHKSKLVSRFHPVYKNIKNIMLNSKYICGRLNLVKI